MLSREKKQQRSQGKKKKKHPQKKSYPRNPRSLLGFQQPRRTRRPQHHLAVTAQNICITDEGEGKFAIIEEEFQNQDKHVGLLVDVPEHFDA